MIHAWSNLLFDGPAFPFDGWKASSVAGKRSCWSTASFCKKKMQWLQLLKSKYCFCFSLFIYVGLVHSQLSNAVKKTITRHQSWSKVLYSAVCGSTRIPLFSSQNKLQPFACSLLSALWSIWGPLFNNFYSYVLHSKYHLAPCSLLYQQSLQQIHNLLLFFIIDLIRLIF